MSADSEPTTPQPEGVEIRQEWLDGLEGDALAQRRQLLDRLAGEGFTADEINRAIAENRLPLLSVDRVFGATFTAREIQEQTGLPARTVAGIRRLQGFPEPDPDDRVFSADDVESARATKLFLDAGISEESIDETTAVLGEGMSRLATTIAAQFLQTFLHEGDSEAEVAQRFTALASELTPAFTPILIAGFTAQLRESVRRGVLGRAELTSGTRIVEHQLAICFVDLVGFTRLGGQLELLELGTVASRFGRLAASFAEPPVRLIKTIGDAAMFVSPEPEAMVDVALALIDAVADEDLPALRAGLAFGVATDRAGDYYGNSVNVASRVTGVARPSSVLCTREVHDACAEAFDWSSTGRHRLKGVSRPVTLYRARPLSAP
jgi:adenylate cyclase